MLPLAGGALGLCVDGVGQRGGLGLDPAQVGEAQAPGLDALLERRTAARGGRQTRGAELVACARSEDKARAACEAVGAPRSVPLACELSEPDSVRAAIAQVRDQGRPLAVGEPANVTLVDPAARWTVRAAELAARSGAATWIGPGREAQILRRMAAGDPLGTVVHPASGRLVSRKQWLAGQLQARGRLSLDQGAVRVLQESGRSLLAVGVTAVEGTFRRGEVVSCHGPDGAAIARGLVNYSAEEARKRDEQAAKKAVEDEKKQYLPAETKAEILAGMVTDVVFEMDADFSHDPVYLPELLAALATAPCAVLVAPTGAGKTTLALAVAGSTDRAFEQLSAVTAGVKDVRETIERARQRLGERGQGTILFLDEIHRFSKAQQDALLPAVEDGTLTLIGATTENPSFELNSALLSRART